MTAHLNIRKFTNPTQIQIMTSSILHPQHEDIDIMVILGEPMQPEAEYYVLSCLFLKNHSLQRLDFVKDSSALFEHIHKLLPKQGYETSRTGGALGYCEKNNDVRNFIYRKGSFPRQRSCCRFILVNTVSKCGVLCYYCRKKDKEYTCWFYNTPRVGGHLKLDENSPIEYPILGVLPECRFQTAILLLYFNSKAESSNQRCARSKAACDFLQEMKGIMKTLTTGQFVGQYLALAAYHTLVTHPVGFHIDSFSCHGNGDVIENKICLINKQKSNSITEIPLGRGGCGPGIYVFAILDWGSGKVDQHRSKMFAFDMKELIHNWDTF